MKTFRIKQYEFRESLPKFWEVYWPEHGFICVDGETEEEIRSSWPTQEKEIVAQLVGA